MKKFKGHRDLGLFGQDFRLEKLSKLGDPLEHLNQGVDFELFRDLLLSHLIKLPKGKGGRPPYNYVLMFKILILQRYYNLSDDQAEFQICDRLTFMRFLGITVADDVPDSKTIWNFREQITDLSLEEKLFELFLKELKRLNPVVNEGKIIDAGFVEVPKQRNGRTDNKTIKNGGIPEDREDKPNKKAQKDIDARWAKKRNQSYYGYKNHVKTCSKSKIITKYKVTGASVHDSQTMEDLLDKEKDKGENLYADSAYTGEKQEDIIKGKGVINQVCGKGYKNNPLTEEQIKNNKEKSKTRVRVGHIFGFMENSMNGMHIKVIGTKRVTTVIGLMNLTYNMFRKIQLTDMSVG